MSVKVLGLTVGVAIALLSAARLLPAQVTRPGETIQYWEYHTEIVRSPASPTPAERGDTRRGAGASPDTMLNAWGHNGWELVGVTRREVRVDDVMETETLFAFKRPTRTGNR